MENDDNEKETENKEDSKVTVEEGPLMQRLRHFLSLSVTKIVSSIRYSLFSENFKTIHANHPKTLAKLHEQMTSQLQQNMTEEIEQMFQEENIVSLMNNLDKLIHDGSSRETPAWRPSGNPDIDVIAHTMGERLILRNQLQEIVKELESRNRMLINKYEKRKASLLDVQNEIEVHVSKLGYEVGI
ncbi:hypothetical protein FSP39_005366 [Pinctada imbricata]|uniref:Uncharacterized protein n=1 Tax=Pinctada imbricata TaxID=66713 RepID=A0AA88Y2S5_PINIB|nr:hypothetical protein FSP39_005366 [Pinctada imbricata]